MTFRELRDAHRDFPLWVYSGRCYECFAHDERCPHRVRRICRAIEGTFWRCLIRLGVWEVDAYQVYRAGRPVWPWQGSRSFWAIAYLQRNGLKAWRERYYKPLRPDRYKVAA